MRLFLACELPATLKQEIGEFAAVRKREFPEASWSSSAALHLTLAFIGEQPAESAPLIGEAIRKRLIAAPRIPGTIDGAGVFPGVRNARIGWLGVSPQEELTELATLAREALRDVAVPFDEKPFRSHVTLARFRQRIAAARASRFVEEFSRFRSAPFPIDEVVLFSSQLSSGGAQHTATVKIMLSAE